MPLTTIIIQHLRKWRQRVMRISDSRMKYVLEVMSGIRIVKLMGWEASFLAKIGEIRVRELSLCARQGLRQLLHNLRFQRLRFRRQTRHTNQFRPPLSRYRRHSNQMCRRFES